MAPPIVVIKVYIILRDLHLTCAVYTQLCDFCNLPCRQDIISSISGRVPPVVEKRIRQLLNQYSYNITSVLTQFPSQKIANVIDRSGLGSWAGWADCLLSWLGITVASFFNMFSRRRSSQMHKIQIE